MSAHEGARMEFAKPGDPEVPVGFVEDTGQGQRVVFTRRGDAAALLKLDGAQSVEEGVAFPAGEQASAAGAYVLAH